MNTEQQLTRLAELSVDELLGTLAPADEAELHGLRAQHPDFDAGSLERAIAALYLAAAPAPQPLPESLRMRLQTASITATAIAAPAAAARRRTDWPRYGGWLAAAACLILAVGTWMSRLPAPAMPATQARAGAADAQAARARLLDAGRPVLRREWHGGGDPAGRTVAGDVVWDPETQTGYMRFTGLARNDPKVEQYQLWIFDAARDQRYPVDGGVFDISSAAGGEVIEIRAKLPVSTPVMFAITVERPGGVVVSDRSRIAALAKST